MSEDYDDDRYYARQLPREETQNGLNWHVIWALLAIAGFWSVVFYAIWGRT